MYRSIATALAIVLLAAPLASAEVLWDRSSFDPFGPGFFNVEAGSPPFGLTVFSVNHVVVDGSGWVMDSITNYYSALDPGWGAGIASGYLHIFTKSGPLPIDGTDDPSASPLVSMSATLNGDYFAVTASGLNMPLAPGEYWIGITPIAGSGPFGPEIHLSSMDPITGDATASYDLFAFPPPPAWFNFNPGIEAAILIEGDRPVPVEGQSWGAIKSLYR